MRGGGSVMGVTTPADNALSGRQYTKNLFLNVITRLWS